MLWVVEYEAFEAYLEAAGFSLIGTREGHQVYRRADTYVVVRSATRLGPLSQMEMEKACDAAGIDPPALAQTFGPP